MKLISFYLKIFRFWWWNFLYILLIFLMSQHAVSVVLSSVCHYRNEWHLRDLQVSKHVVSLEPSSLLHYRFYLGFICCHLRAARTNVSFYHYWSSGRVRGWDQVKVAQFQRHPHPLPSPAPPHTLVIYFWPFQGGTFIVVLFFKCSVVLHL